MKPLISIITVVYNGEKYIEQTIRSVISQDYGQIQYIVIDGNSKDSTNEIIARYREHIDYYISEPDKGLYDALNKGIRQAKGDLIGIMNADDVFADNSCVSAVAEAFGNGRQLVVGHTLMVGEKQSALFRATHSDALHLRIPFMHTSCFIPRQVYERFGDYSLEYKIAADVDLLMRVHKGGVEHHIVDKCITHMREGGMSDKRFKEARKEYRKIFIKHYGQRMKARIGYWKSLLGYYLRRR